MNQRHQRSVDLIDDVTLVERAKGGDRMAFAALIERHQGRTYAVAVAVCGNRDDARDVVQDAYVLAFQRLRTCRDPQSFGAWVGRIAINLAKNQHRSRARRGGRDDRYGRLERGVDEAVEDQVVAADEANAALTALGQLDERDRLILGARYLAGLSEAETALTLGMRPGTVKSRTSRALGRLRALVQEVGE